ncbi:zinc transporter SLC39A7-like isoform X1 [Panonychus citri]|uniref:zinc transporter SLC39A7-like isoform X1 n=1 Tax=Panonychus citri TaxID=50023 RepID=UPI00230785A2|nr:zinc transporter SLC39A7-like isoform X1 [Panonychus citri]
MKVFAIVALFAILAVSAAMADPWKKDNHWGGGHSNLHHQHGKVGYKVDVHHGGWGKHDKGWTELYDSRDKSTGWNSHGHDNGYGHGHGHNNGWKN